MRTLLVRAWMENPLTCTMKRHTSEARRDAILATAARLWKGARPPRRGFRGSKVRQMELANKLELATIRGETCLARPSLTVPVAV